MENIGDDNTSQLCHARSSSMRVKIYFRKVKFREKHRIKRKEKF